jgi:hypothetical protein
LRNVKSVGHLVHASIRISAQKDERLAIGGARA